MTADRLFYQLYSRPMKSAVSIAPATAAKRHNSSWNKKSPSSYPKTDSRKETLYLESIRSKIREIKSNLRRMGLHTVISRNGTSVNGHTKRADHADNLIRHTQTNISLLTQADTTSCSIQIKLSNNHILTLHIHQPVCAADEPHTCPFFFAQ